ncbi:hypothetical protein J7K74_03355, partial [Candidatus Woesearchaeota archaeon]|nr:hypothetical protein [Candidatus Woesearchaeota archaeon]
MKRAKTLLWTMIGYLVISPVYAKSTSEVLREIFYYELKTPFWAKALPALYAILSFLVLFDLFYVLLGRIHLFREENKRQLTALAIAFAGIGTFFSPFPLWLFGFFSTYVFLLYLGILISLVALIYSFVRASIHTGKGIIKEAKKQELEIEEKLIPEEQKVKELEYKKEAALEKLEQIRNIEIKEINAMKNIEENLRIALENFQFLKKNYLEGSVGKFLRSEVWLKKQPHLVLGYN